MPTFATAHTFCASPDGPRKSGLLMAMSAKTERYFCAVYNYAGKADLWKGYWNPKRKLGVTMYFSIKLQFGKKLHTLFCILALFRIIVA